MTRERWIRGSLALGFAVFFLFPLFAMADFSTRDLRTGGRTLASWRNLVSDPAMLDAIGASLGLAALTSLVLLVVLLPTLIWVRLRARWAQGPLEFLCLLPLVVPALVIVVGLRNVYLWIAYLLGDSPLTLTFVYVVLVLPFGYRALDTALAGVDLRTLVEAARSLGAGWTTTVVRVVIPNIWSGILAAAFISTAVVLGEYTIASLLTFHTLPVEIVAVGGTDGRTSIAASLAVLLFGFALLLGLTMLTGGRRRRTSAGV
ncbi:MAG: ABC transporter permease subunit [Mycolicibacterium insubricum]|nr:ABC transporter permease subunit [Mycobacterium sp.]